VFALAGWLLACLAFILVVTGNLGKVIDAVRGAGRNLLYWLRRRG
jgi:hypothetical protein